MLELVLLVACMYHYELKITDYTPVTKEENNAMIIKIPQMILIHLANPLTLDDWIKSKIAHRVFVMIERKLMIRRKVMVHHTIPVTVWTLLKRIMVIIMDPRIAVNWTIAEIYLITLANFLCFIASLSKRIAHRIEPAMRIIHKSTANVEIVTSGVVGSVGIDWYNYKLKII